MKTIYSIGRDPGCDIYLYDDRNVISRTHAILKIGKGGKYFISDQSMNGTYVNGIKISQGVQVPVTRKDVVSFAHMAELDWEQIPNPYGGIFKYVLILLLLVVVAGGVTWGVKEYMDFKSSPSFGLTQSEIEQQQQQEEQAREARQKEFEEELKAEKAKKEAAERKKKAAEEKKQKEENSKKENKKPEEKKVEEPSESEIFIY